jgi:hypothetical protein
MPAGVNLMSAFPYESGHQPDRSACLLSADFVAKVGAFDGGPSVIRLRATGFDLPALMRSTQLSLYAMH